MSQQLGLPSWKHKAAEAYKYFRQSVHPFLYKEMSDKKTIYPDGDGIFRAFRDLEFEQVNVVILGQDPYFDGKAIGRAFDVKLDSPVPPSLRRIIEEIEEDYYEETYAKGQSSLCLQNYIIRHQQPELDIHSSSYFGHLPAQGVLLLNTALTVEHDKPEGHLEIWKPFTKAIIECLQEHRFLVWVMWGNKAQAYTKYITNPKHVVIEGPHPSPLASKKSFRGGKWFTQINSALETKGINQIRW